MLIDTCDPYWNLVHLLFFGRQRLKEETIDSKETIHKSREGDQLQIDDLSIGLCPFTRMDESCAKNECAIWTDSGCAFKVLAEVSLWKMKRMQKEVKESTK